MLSRMSDKRNIIEKRECQSFFNRIANPEELRRMSRGHEFQMAIYMKIIQFNCIVAYD